MLEDGFFQADPHPGNVIYLPGNRIAMIDFGMTGRLSLARRNQIIDLLAGITRRDSEPMVDVLLDWAGEEAVDEERLAADVDELVADYGDLPVKDMRVGELIGRITAMMRTHGIVLPSDLTLMFKALITLEGSGRQYDPEFVLADRLKPFVERALAARYAPAELGRRGGAGIGQFLDLMRAIPRDLARLLKDARRGRLRLDLDLKRLDSFVRRARQYDRPHHHRHHDCLGRHRFVDRDDGHLRSASLRHPDLHGAWLAWLSARIREQRLGRAVDLAFAVGLKVTQHLARPALSSVRVPRPESRSALPRAMPALEDSGPQTQPFHPHAGRRHWRRRSPPKPRRPRHFDDPGLDRP